MQYQPWFIRKPELLEEEIAAFKKKGHHFVLDEGRKSLGITQFNGEVDISGSKVNLQLIYPEEFPAFPIVVLAPEFSLQRHQNPFEKNLCVIPHNQDGWKPSMTGAFMVDQTIRLLEDTQKGCEVVAENEVNAPEPWSNYVTFRYNPLFIAGNIP